MRLLHLVLAAFVMTVTPLPVLGQKEAPARSSDPPAWAAITRQDLAAIRDILAANHPGPVDPENDTYARWLRVGFEQALKRADGATSYSDYVRALRLYTNGFRDGHIGLRLTMEPTRLLWPGFVVRHAEDGTVRVASARADAGVPHGAVLTSCDGRAIGDIAMALIAPFYWNEDIPHERQSGLPELFVRHPGDTEFRPSECRFVVNGNPIDVAIRWGTESREVVASHIALAEPASPALGMRRLGETWIVSVPSFQYSGKSAEEIRALIESVTSSSAEIRKGLLVLDVRGNRGGNSSWGNLLAAAIWGEEATRAVARSFDWTVDWRVSPDNIEHLTRVVQRNRGDGLESSARSWERARDQMIEAQARGESLLRIGRPAVNPPRVPAPPESPRIFLLTDERCASACLDFADIVLRMPDVMHIGRPTSGDAVYMDNTYAALPGGLAGLSYSLKVYRNRVRSNNEWYEPHRLLPTVEGMTDETIAALVREISSP